jgi:scaffold Nfu/NifU family protein
MPYRVVEIQPTPNPNAAKFVLDRAVAEQPTSFFNADAAKGHALAEALFGVSGVSSLLFLGDFVTVNKTPDAQWNEVTARVKAILANS